MIPVQQRRWIARAVKLGLVGAAVVVVMAWIDGRRGHDRTRLRIEPHPEPSVVVHPSPAPEVRPGLAAGGAGTLAPGDMRIFNEDSSVNLVLRGAEVLAGLSPQMRDRITEQISQSTSDDSSGFGAAIASVVKSTVASAIATHAVYPVHDIREIEYEDGQIIIVRNSGRRVELLGNVKTDGEKISRTFAREDALRFVEAVRARKRALERHR